MAHKTVITAVSNLEGIPATKEACLVVIYGVELGKKYSLEQPTIHIGRSSKSEIQIDQESVSRNHAKIVRSGKTLIVSDLQSTNGTYVNDEPIEERPLEDGDFVKIGRTIFKFLSGANVEAAYHEEIYRLTTSDGLTQIYNKRYFLEMLERELSRAKRYRRPLSLIMFDIDHFKNINDTHGHLTGDFVLKKLSAVVKAKVRREDVFARYGGEEFAIILPEIDHTNGLVLAEKVRRLIERTSFRLDDDTTIPVTVSIGVGGASDAEDVDALIERTDVKMYEAKRAGRNCVRG